MSAITQGYNPKDPRRNEFARWIDEPRIWEDASGHPHFDIPEILKMVDLPATEENIQLAMGIMHRMAAGQAAAHRLIERHSKED